MSNAYSVVLTHSALNSGVLNLTSFQPSNSINGIIIPVNASL